MYIEHFDRRDVAIQMLRWNIALVCFAILYTESYLPNSYGLLLN